jgi:hypothetical protein
MPVQVLFRGPILYLRRGQCAELALVPNGERVLMSDDGRRAAHPDGTPAKPHYAGLVVFEGPDYQNEILRMSLRSKLVLLIGGNRMECRLERSFDYLVPIDEVANEGMNKQMTLLSSDTADYWSRVATRVEFHGGSIRSDVESKAKFRIDGSTRYERPQSIPLAAAWNAHSDAAALQICNSDGTGLVQVGLERDQTAFIYNWDERTPAPANLIDLPECVHKPDPEIEDADFKWLYELFDPPSANYTSWIGVGKQLRAPLTQCHDRTVDERGNEILSPGSSSCGPGSATLG